MAKNTQSGINPNPKAIINPTIAPTKKPVPSIVIYATMRPKNSIINPAKIISALSRVSMPKILAKANSILSLTFVGFSVIG